MRKILLYAAACIVMLSLGALTGWYLLLRSKTQQTATTDAARGLDAIAPAFGGSLGSNSANEASSTAATGTNTPQPAARLWQVDKATVAGAAFDATRNASSTRLYFVERGNGYVFAADPIAQKATRLTNTLLPKTYEALFVPGQQAVLLRSVGKDGAITTSYASYDAASSSVTSIALAAKPLPDSIRQIAMNPAGGTFLELTASSSKTVVSSVALPSLKQRAIFSSSFGSWRVQAASNGTLLTETPADDTDGFVYRIVNGTLTPLLGPLPGLEVSPNPSTDALLYSTSQNGTLALYVQTGKNAPTQTPLHTIADKCLWAPGKSLIAYCAVPASVPSSHFLNDWFAGQVHTSDVWWQLDAATGEVQQIYTPTQSLDVQRPTIDPTGNYIAFVNGSDQSLWALRVAQ
jgi:hypothetical protein